jgi:hypothetical protein
MAHHPPIALYDRRSIGDLSERTIDLDSHTLGACCVPTPGIPDAHPACSCDRIGGSNGRPRHASLSTKADSDVSAFADARASGTGYTSRRTNITTANKEDDTCLLQPLNCRTRA